MKSCLATCCLENAPYHDDILLEKTLAFKKVMQNTTEKINLLSRVKDTLAEMRLRERIEQTLPSGDKSLLESVLLFVVNRKGHHSISDDTTTSRRKSDIQYCRLLLQKGSGN